MGVHPGPRVPDLEPKGESRGGSPRFQDDSYSLSTKVSGSGSAYSLTSGSSPVIVR